ncbi:NAD(P)/FAD-dependent oxidoreductase [Paracandidimonas soli]|uniref:NAD(P)/FAD-dependent oxidoreductase n=1 Tax=Paracandidimonas soli TaxID=1917182 RepID=UPI00333FAE8A
MDTSFDTQTLIIGAGIIGLTIAVDQHLRGQTVVLLDPDGPSSRASYGNAGYLSPASIFPPASYVSATGLLRMLVQPSGPLVIRPGHLPNLLPWLLRMLRANQPHQRQAGAKAMAALHRNVVADYAPLLRAAEAEEFIDAQGALAICASPAMLGTYRRKAREQQAHGFACETVSPDRARELEPVLGDTFAGGIYFADAARCVDPGELGVRLAACVTKGGGQLVRHAATRLRPAPGGGWLVDSTERTWRARRVIVAAGRWSDRLLTPLGYRVPLASERGYHLMLPTPGVSLNRPIIFADGFFTATTMRRGMRLAGTAEFADADAPMDAKRAWILYEQARQHLPELDASGAVPWMGVRPALPDARPALGQARGHEGLYYCFGNHYQGMTQAATCARLMGKLLAGETPDIDLAPFDLNRFQ